MDIEARFSIVRIAAHKRDAAVTFRSNKIGCQDGLLKAEKSKNGTALTLLLIAPASTNMLSGDHCTSYISSREGRRNIFSHMRPSVTVAQTLGSLTGVKSFVICRQTPAGM